MMNTLPFRCTGLQPSQSRLTEERVFMPRVCELENDGVEIIDGLVDVTGRCRHWDRMDEDLAKDWNVDLIWRVGVYLWRRSVALEEGTMCVRICSLGRGMSVWVFSRLSRYSVSWQEGHSRSSCKEIRIRGNRSQEWDGIGDT